MSHKAVDIVFKTLAAMPVLESTKQDVSNTGSLDWQMRRKALVFLSQFEWVKVAESVMSLLGNEAGSFCPTVNVSERELPTEGVCGERTSMRAFLGLSVAGQQRKWGKERPAFGNSKLPTSAARNNLRC